MVSFNPYTWLDFNPYIYGLILTLIYGLILCNCAAMCYTTKAMRDADKMRLLQSTDTIARLEAIVDVEGGAERLYTRRHGCTLC